MPLSGIEPSQSSRHSYTTEARGSKMHLHTWRTIGNVEQCATCLATQDADKTSANPYQTHRLTFSTGKTYPKHIYHVNGG